MVKTTTVIRLLASGLVVAAAGCAIVGHKSPDPYAEYIPARVVRISEEYANINTDLSGEKLRTNGIELQTVFQVKFKERTISAMLGSGYSDVPRGDWVGLIEEDGNLQLAISFGNAAVDLGCKVGDTLYIEPIVGDEQP